MALGRTSSDGRLVGSYAVPDSCAGVDGGGKGCGSKLLALGVSSSATTGGGVQVRQWVGDCE